MPEPATISTSAMRGAPALTAGAAVATAMQDVAALNAADAAAWTEAARRGDFARAWELSDRIRARTTNRADASMPRHLQQIWGGTPLEGKRVLVRCYHGLGDTIQFARYLPRLSVIAREVIVWAQPALLPLLGTLDARLSLLPLHDGAPDVDYDVDIEIMELAHAFRTALETIPGDIPYLRAPRAAPVLPSGGRPIGIAWRAGGWDTRRSIEFSLLTPLLEDPAIRARWYALQIDRGPGEDHPALRAFDDVPGGACAVMSETAAWMRAMSLVIAVDSMPAHLAGALGCRVWTLLPDPADWRWMEKRDDSPWYPTMRLFRQSRPGEWAGVIEAVRTALATR
jgi:hypothetical protein